MEGKPDWLSGFPVQIYCNSGEQRKRARAHQGRFGLTQRPGAACARAGPAGRVPPAGRFSLCAAKAAAHKEKRANRP